MIGIVLFEGLLFKLKRLTIESTVLAFTSTLYQGFPLTAAAILSRKKQSDESWLFFLTLVTVNTLGSGLTRTFYKRANAKFKPYFAA